MDMFYDKEKCPIGDVMLEVKDLQLTKDSPKVSFTVRKGEIVGFSGMVGSGRTELVRALVGADSGRLMPACAMLGGAYLLLMDDLARSILTMELPIGVVTSIMGAPFFVYLIIRRKG